MLTVMSFSLIQGGEMWDTKTTLCNIVSLHVLGTCRCFAFFALCYQLVMQQIRELLLQVEQGSTLSHKFWSCCMFFIKLPNCLGSTPSKSTNQHAAFLIHSKCLWKKAWKKVKAKGVKKVKHLPKTCNKTMLCNKLRLLYLVFCHL